jgi:hypothetical protein
VGLYLKGIFLDQQDGGIQGVADPGRAFGDRF